MILNSLRRVYELARRYAASTSVREVGFTFITRCTAAGAGLAVNFALARVLGADGTGVFYIASAITGVVALVARVGLDNVVVRTVGVYVSRGRKSLARSAFNTAISMVCIVGLLGTGLFYLLLAFDFHRIFGDPALKGPLLILLASAIPLALVQVEAGGLKGLGNAAEGVAVNSAAIPLLTAPLVVVLGQAYSVSGAAAAKAIAAGLVAAGGYWRWSSNLSAQEQRGVHDSGSDRTESHPTEDVPTSWRELLASGIPLFLASSLHLVISWTDTLVLGIFHESTAVGVYEIALRMSTVVTYVLVAINAVVAPRYAALWSDGDTEDLESLARTVLVASAILSSFVGIGLVVFSTPLLGLFGSEFVAGEGPLHILLVGQWVNAATGSVGYLLIMTGRERLMRNTVAAAALANVLLNLVLVPPLGAVGAALATSCAFVVENIYALWLTRQELDLAITPF